MLPAKRNPIQSQSNVIAGSASGVKVLCSDRARPKYNELQAMAQAGNYWAFKIVAGITGLSCGRMHMDNIFVQQNQGYPRNLFYAVLPGALAIFENTFKGAFELVDLQADAGYMEMQRKMQRPGLWRVDKELEKEPGYIEDGVILNKEFRSVVISGRAEDNVLTVAQSAVKDLKKVNSTISQMVDLYGLDLHYTPGKGEYRGLVPEKQLMLLENGKDKDLAESAYLLAKTMHQARDIPGVLWYSHWDGSVILSRAMQILVKQKVTLSNHSIFLNRPLNERSETSKLAEQLGIKKENVGHKSGMLPKEIVYNHLGSHVSKKGMDAGTAFSLSAASAATTAAAAMFPAVASATIGWAGALYFVSKSLISLKGGLSRKSHK